MISLILWSWCLPQSLLGALFLFSLKLLKKDVGSQTYEGICVVYVQEGFIKGWSGFSAGAFIFLNARLLKEGREKDHEWVLRHEYGHTLQGYLLGPLYVLMIGLSSGFLWLLSRFRPSFRAHYHSFFPENWANHLVQNGEPPQRV